LLLFYLLKSKRKVCLLEVNFGIFFKLILKIKIFPLLVVVVEQQLLFEPLVVPLIEQHVVQPEA